MSSSTFTAYIQYPVWSPDWKSTVQTLADLANLCYAEFVSDRLYVTNIFLFEVFGATENVEWFEKNLLKEDRKRKYIKYYDVVELQR
jgi:hypothetical protein